jgi:hypothetical protein
MPGCSGCHGFIGAAVAAWSAVALVGSYELLMTVVRNSQAVPHGASVARAFRTRFRTRQPWYSPMSWQRIAFLRSGRSVPGCTSASPERSGCESTSLLDLRDGLRILLRERIAKGASS